MKKITYGTYRYVEYDVTMNINGKEVNVHFNGGSISAHGVTPATYTTSNPVVQCAIEKLTSYKQGKIVKVREIEIQPTPEVQAELETESQVDDKHVDVETVKGLTATEETSDEAVGDGLTKVAATCREDVVEYLKANFGYSGMQLRGDKLKAAVVEHKLEVVGFEL